MDGLSKIRRGGIAAALLVLGVSTLLGGCNKQNKQADLAQQEAAELREKNAALEAQIGEKNSRIAELEGRVAQVQGNPGGDGGWSPPTGGSNRNPGGSTEFRTGRDGNPVATISGDVLFDSGQVTVKPAAKKQLDRIAADIKRNYGGAYVRVDGYTDSDPIRKSKWGTNEALSEARANAVRDYLASKGISSSRISTMGMGSSNPKSTKAASRRVEVVILQ